MIFDTFSEFYKKNMNLNEETIQAWIDKTLFTYHWWLGVILIIVPYILWFKFRKRKSADRLHYAGLFVALASSTLDYVGTFFGLWKYDYEVIPIVPTYTPFSFAILPITVMFILQIKPKINPFLKAFAFAVFSLIALPIVKGIGIYDPVKWNYFYSFIIQYIMYLIAHYLGTRNRFAELKEQK
ncbi:CBO0543 family protein [uncultured Metabacillus sp.]|uniref:CBO0543 family protein n=1 Tax=uncultured Metabacillus sp. TaxID=2860135 RepID=UPI00260F0061|nr:CBO0543 family protein [uncultured Metabacillus sp.]